MPRQLNENARPVRYQRRPRKQVHLRQVTRKSYHALDVFCTVCVVIAVIAGVFGMAFLYQVGYEAGLAHMEQVENE